MRYGTPRARSPDWTRSNWRRRVVGQALGDAGRVGDGGDGHRTLGVEHPHGVGLHLLGVGRIEVTDAADQVAADGIHVASAVVGGAHRVHDQLDLAQAEVGVEVPQEADDLDVEVGVGRAEGFDPELVVLAVAPGLGPLVPEARSGVPDLPGRGRTVLDEGPHHRRRALRPQGQVAVALVLEVVHLLADDIGALAHAGEHAELLEHGALHEPVAGPTHVSGEPGDEGLPPGRLGRKDVAGAHRGLERLGSGHRGRGGHDR